MGLYFGLLTCYIAFNIHYFAASESYISVKLDNASLNTLWLCIYSITYGVIVPILVH